MTGTFQIIIKQLIIVVSSKNFNSARIYLFYVLTRVLHSDYNESFCNFYVKFLSDVNNQYISNYCISVTETQGFYVAEFVTLFDERMLRSKNFLLLIQINEPFVRKFEGSTRSLRFCKLICKLYSSDKYLFNYFPTTQGSFCVIFCP